MTEQEEISELASAVFQAWKQAGIGFLVLRNYEQLPRYTSNDIDVLVHPSQRSAAEGVMLEAAATRGFRRHNRAEFATLASFFSSASSTAQVHFDLFVDLKWRSFDYIRCEDFLPQRVHRGLFAIPHPAHEAATSLLSKLIFTGAVAEKYKPSISAGFRHDPGMATKLLARSYGEKQARFLVEAGVAQDWEKLQRATACLRRTLVLRELLRRPLASFISMASDAKRLIGRWARSPGLVVVLCGADGSGKSTAAKALIESLATTFSPAKGRQFHWKPPVFSGRRMARRQPTTDPHAAAPRSPLLSLIYFAFHWFEFFLGSYLRMKPVTFKGGLVLIDRWYYDFFVDQRRYRLRIPQALVRLAYFFLKKPDLVLLLDAAPEILQQRKQEVPLAETQRQREAYLTLVRSLPQGRVVDVSQTPEKVAHDLKRMVLELMAARMLDRECTVSAEQPGGRGPENRKVQGATTEKQA